MKIGRFLENGRESIGAIHGDYWIDLPALMEHNGQKLYNFDLEYFLLMNKDELTELENKIKKAFGQKESHLKLFYPLKKESFLPPVPKVPRLFTQRGNGSIFSRIGASKKPTQPVFELRYPHNLKGHNCTAIFDDNYTGGGWNIELVAVIGKPGKNIKEEDAYKHIAGYTIMIDHSATMKDSPFLKEWFTKPEERDITDNFYLGCFNGNAVVPTPIGPWITTSDEIPDPHNLWVVEREKDRLVGKIHSSSLTYYFAEVISFMSRFIALKPGDMVSSASIGYDGYKHWEHYEEGSYIEVGVEKIGYLRMYIKDERGNME